MKGLTLSQSYYEAYGKTMLEREFSNYMQDLAVGLVGEGSECFGYDDQYSQDHDFGPGFCIWLPDDVYQIVGKKMQEEYDKLPAEYMSFAKQRPGKGGQRTGVFSIGEFYKKYTGLAGGPIDNIEWMLIPESFLATATNGQVFMDNKGKFSAIRERLLGFYPRDIFYKKLAARMVTMAQAGQYNYPRMVSRGDLPAANLACNEFLMAALSAVYLLNGVYMPFYKWAFRKTEDMTVLRTTVADLKELALLGGGADSIRSKETLIGRICQDIARELNRRGMARTSEEFLESHGEELMEQIEDSRIAGLPILYDCK